MASIWVNIVDYSSLLSSLKYVEQLKTESITFSVGLSIFVDKYDIEGKGEGTDMGLDNSMPLRVAKY